MTQRYLDQHARFLSSAVGPGWLMDARRASIARFVAAGFPTTKNEDWHFTSVAPIVEREFVFDAQGHASPAMPSYELPGDAFTVVFRNGRCTGVASGGLDRGVRVLSLADAWTVAPDLARRVGTVLSDQPAFTALNSAFMADGAIVHVAKDVSADLLIHLVFLSDDTAPRVTYPRNLIVVERGAKATVVETYAGPDKGSYFTNAVTEVILSEGATLDHCKIQREGRKAFHVGTIDVTQARDSHYRSFSFASGGALSRTNIYTTLRGEGAGATLNGLYMLDGEQHCDHQTKIEHVAPNCFSREVYKGVLDGRSHGVFNGKVYVHPEAQKTDGKQTNNSLLLSREAQVDTKPQLEIFADDVKCTHGATVGRLDENALFYMKSRGVDTETARRLLIYAFAADVLETIASEDVRSALERDALGRFVSEAVTA